VIRRRNQSVLLGLLMTAAWGCAGQLPNVREGRAAGEWQVRLPTSSSPVGALAYGSGGSSTPADMIAPESEPQLAAAKVMTPAPRITHKIAAPKAAIAMASAPVVAPQPESQPVVAPESQPQAAPVQLAQAESKPEQRYAEREAAAQSLEQYKAGDAIVIGAGTLVVVLLIVLLVVLLIR
jgi:hypothetical protein